jgi:hypothetical protein
VGCDLFDAIVLVLAGATLRGDCRATVHFLEIAEGNLVSPLGVRGMLVIDTEMPCRERFDSVLASEFVSCPYLDVSFTDDKGTL